MEDYNIESPNIVILPAENEVRKAVDALKQQPGLASWLAGVKEIVVESIPGKLGYVTNREGDENIIFIDYYRLKSDLQSQLPNLSPQEFQNNLVNRIMEVLSHEKGHLSAGLDAGEGPAEQAQQQTVNYIKQQNEMPITAAIKIYNSIIKKL